MCSMLLAGRAWLTGEPQSGSPCRRNSATDADPDEIQGFVHNSHSFVVSIVFHKKQIQ